MIRDSVGVQNNITVKGSLYYNYLQKHYVFFFSVFGSELLLPISAPPVQFSSNAYPRCLARQKPITNAQESESGVCGLNAVIN